MMGFDDRDLAHHAVAAGFSRVDVECHIDIEPAAPMHGAQRFIVELARTIDAGAAVRRMAVAYVVAHK